MSLFDLMYKDEGGGFVSKRARVYVFVVLIGLGIIPFFSAQALIGDYLPVEELLPQICRITLSRSDFCSGTIVGPRFVALAQHCRKGYLGVGGRLKGVKVRCLGEMAGAGYEVSDVHLKWPNAPLITNTSPLSESSGDVMIVEVQGEFRTPPLKVASRNDAAYRRGAADSEEVSNFWCRT